MPVQSQVISCPVNQWTAIAQYLDRRTSLLVQCPERSTTTNYIKVTNVWAAAATQIVGANTLRKSLMVSSSDPKAQVVSINAVDAAALIGIPLPAFAGGALSLPLQIDDSWGEWSQQAWYLANASGGGTSTATAYEELWNCAAVILGINTSVSLIAGPYGNAPSGLWQTPDLSGPQTFNLSKLFDGDLVIQEWFAWPVGTAGLTIPIQVFQSFDDAPIPDYFSSFQVSLPQLSTEGKMHLSNLLRRADPAQQPDFSGAGEFRGGAQRPVSPLGGTGLAGGSGE